jgi:peptide/nickel transport system ATP-binding protein
MLCGMTLAANRPAEAPRLVVTELTKSYLSGGWPYGPRRRVPALQGVSFTLRKNASIALVGESGSGKSTLAMCVCGLLKADSGTVSLDGVNLLSLPRKTLRALRTKVQIVFQDSATAFNPTLKTWQIISEPLAIRGTMSSKVQLQKSLDLLSRVGLPQDSANRYPLQFSGGQRQRLAIARALAAEPEVLILDESLSGLDMTVQSEIATLLLDLQAERELSLIYISHDLELASVLAKEIYVMSDGSVVESGDASQIISSPQHPQTQKLIAAVLDWKQ